MPDVSVVIGGRTFEVACQDGEERFLQAAAGLLDAEAATLADQIGRLPESRMLLMAGLMLADKTAGLEEQLRGAEARLESTRSELTGMKSAPRRPPDRIEVPVIPPSVTESLAEIAARAEALAQALEERSAPSSA